MIALKIIIIIFASLGISLFLHIWLLPYIGDLILLYRLKKLFKSIKKRNKDPEVQEHMNKGIDMVNHILKNTKLNPDDEE